MKKEMEYIQRDGIKAKVIKIKIEHLSGKIKEVTVLTVWKISVIIH